jgi:hypothetical protein
VFDNSRDIIAYHDDRVTLSQAERTAMRDRRDSNRDRLKSRLSESGKPLPTEFIKQGSYAMKTMTQDPDNDYDIDDGVYFTRDALKDAQGVDMAPQAARQMVCDALQDSRFERAPEVKKSCVRILYRAGYHVDMPVYRVISTAVGDTYELACGDEWVASRAADVEEWFDAENQRQSPDTTNGRQMRRITRLIKKFARSRNAWKADVAAGFTITKLVQEHYCANINREDTALRDTMRAIHSRLRWNLQVQHPVTPGALLTDSVNDAKTAFLRDRLKEALDVLSTVDRSDCTSKEAADAWDRVFDTTFFSERVRESSKAANATVLQNLLSKREQPRQYEKEGGGRFA